MLCGGNLRIWDDLPAWTDRLSPYLDGLTIKAENAFGTQICVDKDGMAVLFWPRELDTEELGIAWEELLSLVKGNSSIMLEQDMFDRAIAVHGVPTNSQHFAWRLPPEAGGNSSVENLEILDAELDIQRQIEWGRQLKGIPLGTKLSINIV